MLLRIVIPVVCMIQEEEKNRIIKNRSSGILKRPDKGMILLNIMLDMHMSMVMVLSRTMKRHLNGI